MKKIISILLAALMITSLAACAGTKPSEATTSPSPSEVVDVTLNENEIGFFESGVDPLSRETYNIVFAYPRPMQLMQNITDVLEELAPKLNYSITGSTGDNDIDVYIHNLEIYASQGVDGFICVIDPNSADRIVEVLEEVDIPYIALLNTVRDSSGSAVVPCVALDGYAAGQTQMQWLYDYYKNYWGDIDTTKVGLVDITFSPNKDFQDRYEGARDKFKELFPNNEVFTADGVIGKMDTDTGYNMTSAIFSANPDVEYWFVVSCLEQYAQGAARAAEGMNIDNKTLVSCVGSDILSSEWDIGYDGCWVTCLAVSDYGYTAPTISALIALIDGTATQESLWASRRAPGDAYTVYYISNEMVTKDTYQAYFDRIEKAMNLEN